jgi:DNA repair protein RadD
MTPDDQTDAFDAGPLSYADPVPTDWLDTLPAVAECLRLYQRTQVEQTAQALRTGARRILIQGATGSGKTHIIAVIVAAAVIAGIPVLILATRTRLVRQIHERLTEFEIPHGVIAASLPNLRNYSAWVQIASVDTLHRRSVVDRHIPMPPAGLVLFDECHLATADTRLNILDSYPDAIRIGLTATPARKSGRSLSAAFDCLILGPTPRDLVSAGMLVPFRIFNTPLATQTELKALPKDNENDYRTDALSALVCRPKLVGDVLENWLRIARGKRTLLFCVNKAHGGALLAEFLRNGIKAEMLTDQDDEATREEVVARLERGETHVLINCFLLSYGVDVPSVECIVLARPTRSLPMYLQMVGRGSRPSPETGKAQCVLIDHGHVVENLGLPQSDFPWTLDETRNVNREAQERARSVTAETLRTCKQCSALWLTSEQGHACPECGWTPAPKSKPVTVQHADLEEMADQEAAIVATDECVAMFYRMACGWDMKRSGNLWKGADPQSGKPQANKRRFVAWLRTRERFKFPDTVQIPKAFWDLAPMEPSAEAAGWLKFALIRYVRGRGRAA